MSPYEVIRRPIITEKVHEAKEEAGLYVFEVHKDATKIDIRNAVETIWQVKVRGVRTINVGGKPKRFRHAKGNTRDWKKAMVTLAKDQVIDALK